MSDHGMFFVNGANGSVTSNISLSEDLRDDDPRRGHVPGAFPGTEAKWHDRTDRLRKELTPMQRFFSGDPNMVMTRAEMPDGVMGPNPFDEDIDPNWYRNEIFDEREAENAQVRKDPEFQAFQKEIMGY